jgi:hypothetical protein
MISNCFHSIPTGVLYFQYINWMVKVLKTKFLVRHVTYPTALTPCYFLPISCRRSNWTHSETQNELYNVDDKLSVRQGHYVSPSMRHRQLHLRPAKEEVLGREGGIDSSWRARSTRRNRFITPRNGTLRISLGKLLPSVCYAEHTQAYPCQMSHLYNT